MLASLAIPLLASLAIPHAIHDDGAVAEELIEKMIHARHRTWREEAWIELFELARANPGVRPIVRTGLETFWQGSTRRMNTSSHRRAFEDLVEARTELDELRARTSNIVFDKKRYPYPFEEPAATRQQARAFSSAQGEIDRAVERMRKLWDDGATVKIPSALRRTGERALWARQKARALKSELEIVVDLGADDVPAWLLGLPFEVEDDPVSLRSFALSIEEADALSRGRAIRRENEERLAALAAEARDALARKELEAAADLLRGTNDYRDMLGYPPLVWSSRLYRALAIQANFLRDQNSLTHDHPDPILRTPMDRARYVRFDGRVWEICCRPTRSATVALRLFTSSSEHHRTILQPSATAIAAASAEDVWLQLVGATVAPEAVIETHPWRR
ncbi:MAG: CAP domain-containing protein [Planctomycetota bacterium]